MKIEKMFRMGMLGEGPNRPEIGTSTDKYVDTKIYCRNLPNIGEKIIRPKPSWIPADWGDHYDTLYNVCYGGHDGQTANEYGDVIGYRIDPGNSTYRYFDTNGKFLYASPRPKGGIPAPLIAAAIAYFAPPLAAAINESLTAASTFESAATTQAVSQGIAQTTLQVATGTPIDKAIKNNVANTLITTQSADATNAVNSVLNDAEVSAAIVTTAGIIAKNTAAGASNATVTKAVNASINQTQLVKAVNNTAATIPTNQEVTMATTAEIIKSLYQSVLNRTPAQAEIDYWVNTFGPTVEPAEVVAFQQAAAAEIAAKGTAVQEIVNSQGIDKNMLMYIGLGLAALLLLRR